MLPQKVAVKLRYKVNGSCSNMPSTLGLGSHYCYSFIKKGKGVPIVVQQKRIQLGTMRFQVRSLASLSGLRTRACCELWCRLQMWLESGVAVAVASSYSSDWAPSLGTSTCRWCSPKKTKKKEAFWKYFTYQLLVSTYCLWIKTSYKSSHSGAMGSAAFGNSETWVGYPAQHSRLRIWSCHGCSFSHDWGWDLIPGLGAPYARRAAKNGKKEEKTKNKKHLTTSLSTNTLGNVLPSAFPDMSFLKPNGRRFPLSTQ